MSGRGWSNPQMLHLAVGMDAEGNDGVCTGTTETEGDGSARTIEGGLMAGIDADTELAPVQGQGTPRTAGILVTCQQHSDFSSLAAQTAPHCLQER
jgi:hypothetical protein